VHRNRTHSKKSFRIYNQSSMHYTAGPANQKDKASAYYHAAAHSYTVRLAQGAGAPESTPFTTMVPRFARHIASGIHGIHEIHEEHGSSAGGRGKPEGALAQSLFPKPGPGRPPRRDARPLPLAPAPRVHAHMHPAY
jgi:hypothetical protein